MILILIYNVKITIEYISAFKLFYVVLKKKNNEFFEEGVTIRTSGVLTKA